jgi:hypothetical protein
METKIPPRKAYCGLTIIMSHPSRFDHKAGHLLSGNAGSWFLQEALAKVNINFHTVEIRLTDVIDEFLPGTRVVLCLGQFAQTTWMGVNTTIGEQRGSPVVKPNGIIFVSSFTPQDAFDPVNYEQRFQDSELADAKVNTLDELTSRHGKTARTNYRFWLEADLKKVSFLLAYKIPLDKTEIIFLDDPCEKLAALTGVMYSDIETAPDLSVRVFAFAEDDGPVYVVPLMDHNDNMTDIYPRILLHYCAAMRRAKRVVFHNGGCYDWLVLTWRYNLPFFSWNFYDTMVAQHRCFPDIEKSLGHCISYWTCEPYHKNTGVYNPTNEEDQQSLMHYCGKDVSAMRLVYKAQLSYAEKTKGLLDSITRANDAMIAYIPMLFHGLRINMTEADDLYKKLIRRCELFKKVALDIIGDECLAEIKTKGSKSSILGSRFMLAKYLTDYAGIKITSLTKTGGPALGETALYKIALNLTEPNPIITLTLAYRTALTAASVLKITPWYNTFSNWLKHNALYSHNGTSEDNRNEYISNVNELNLLEHGVRDGEELAELREEQAEDC